MSLIRAILNNGFFFIVLIVAAAVYLAYSDNIKRDHGLLPEEPTTVANEESHQPKAVNMTSAPAVIATTDESTPSENNVDTAPEKDVVISESPSKQTPSTESENLTSQSEEIPTAEAVAAVVMVSNPLIDNNDSNEAASTEQDSENIETTKTDVNEPTAPVNQASLQNTTVLTPELDAILNDDNMSIKTPDFKTQQEALVAAHEATTKEDYLTAAKIYMDTAKKQPSANVVGLLAQSLYQADKKEWAAKAWLESAKMLVAENRFKEAAMLSARLAPIAPAEAREIQMNLQKMHQAHMAKKRAAMKARMIKQQQMMQSNMPQQNMQAMPPIKPVPKYNYAPMKPVVPMQPMQQIPQQNMQAMPPMKPMPKYNYAPMKPMAQMPPMQQMPQHNMQATPPMKPMPKYNYAPMKPMVPMQPMQQMPQQNMQAMPPMKPMAKYNYAPMKPTAPMQPMQQMPQQNMQAMPSMQPNPQMLEMQKAQQARYQAYLEYMRKQQQMMSQRNMPPMPMPMPTQPNSVAPTN
ncbi:MAG: hypothetical protein U9N57_10235 [Pseudomonadota bacterium]|nr:hypothetical protein [Pseudomonadota bacterium]